LIKAGSMTLIDAIPYNCVKIEGKVAYLKRVGDETRGRFKKMDAKLVPYVNEKDELIVPKPPPVNRKRMSRFHFMKVIKEATDLPLSHDLAYYVAEHLESLVYTLAAKAEDNAIMHGDDRITAAHWYHLQLSPQQGNGKWEENREFAKDYKEHLISEAMKPEEVEDV
jgi:hypothetical protein|tara:strand:+ start:3402 stop:3902 length:501 start_codon:yes stop_codon:yes gene_type:complete